MYQEALYLESLREEMRTEDRSSPQTCKDLRVWQSFSVSMRTTVHPPGGFACFGVTMDSALPR